MISDLDEVLRQLLIRELPVKNGEVDIAFDQPKREWSSRISRPTLNLFLYDLRENNTLRQPEWQIKRNSDGTATKRRTPVRIDLHYVITAWAADPGDEHRLLTRTLMALCRIPTLPDDLLPESLQDQPVSIPVRVAQRDEFRSPADLWSAIDNELRPAIACTLTLALNPYQAISGPLVRTRDLRFTQTPDPAQDRSPEGASAGDRFWMVGGTLRGDGPFEGVRLVLAERGQPVPVQKDGRFVVGNLEAGTYTLEVSIEGHKPKRHKIVVPSKNYDLEI
ncbi:MAG: DUF4255 domain-containing protein [Chloroflexi bacterium]|nr:DUF4255 domain-containing protein [Chloroflexota bacterium]